MRISQNELTRTKNLFKFSFFTSMLVIILAGCSGSEFSSAGCVGDDCDVGGQSFSWDESAWSTCDKACGGGSQTRTVVCRDNQGTAVADTNCTGTKPATSQICNVQSCVGDYTWLTGTWGECSQSCGGGTRDRSVVCKFKDGSNATDNKCPAPKPATSEVCNPQGCTAAFIWKMSAWSTCTKTCGNGTQTRNVTCVNQSDQVVSDSNCDGTRPVGERLCNTQPCSSTYTWYSGDWGNCSKSCGSGIQTRAIACLRNDGQFVAESFCTDTRPVDSKTCNTQACGPTCTNNKTINASVPASSNLLDILIVMDDSGSMAADNLKLGQKLKGFTDELKAKNITDWQMCITTTDVSYYKGRAIQWKGHNSHILKSTTANLATIFVETVKWIGHGWSNDEQGIKAMNLAVLDNVKSNCFRSNAALSVIVISDEDERSVGGNQSLSQLQYKPLEAQNYPSSFPTTVKGNLGNAKKFNVNSIVVKDSACKALQDAQGADSTSFYGTKYIELSNLTKGGVGSICNADYTSNLTLFANKITHTMSSISLQCRPITAPTVTVNPAVSGQTFNVVEQELIFSPVIKGPASVTGTYCCAQ